jgi:hypothetical protein
MILTGDKISSELIAKNLTIIPFNLTVFYFNQLFFRYSIRNQSPKIFLILTGVIVFLNFNVIT